MSATVDLGHLRLTHPQTGTRLDGSVAIATKTTGMFATDKITELSLEELLLSKTAWVCRGPGLRFTMNLLVDGSPLPSEDMTLLERNLQSADLWHQLHLKASIPAENNKDGNNTLDGLRSIAVELSLERDTTQTCGSARHKLMQSVPLADVKPPVGIPVIEIVSVNIDVSICSPPRGHRKRKRTASSPQLPSNPPSSRSTADQQRVEDLSILSDVHVGSEASILTVYDRKMSYDNDFILFDEDLHNNWGDLFEDLVTGQETIMSQEFESELTDEQNFMQECLFTTQQKPEVDTTVVWRLLDVCIRRAISGAPLHTTFGIKTKKSLEDRSLADIAPALFSPGYLHAVARRSVFMPTISHAISQSLWRNAQSESLKKKLLRIAEVNQNLAPARSTQPSGQEPSDAELTRQIQANFSIHLWAFVQRTMYDSKAARKLRPLWSAEGCEEGPFGRQVVAMGTEKEEMNPASEIWSQVRVSDEVERTLFSTDDDYGSDESTFDEMLFEDEEHSCYTDDFSFTLQNSQSRQEVERPMDMEAVDMFVTEATPVEAVAGPVPCVLLGEASPTLHDLVFIAED